MLDAFRRKACDSSVLSSMMMGVGDYHYLGADARKGCPTRHIHFFNCLSPQRSLRLVVDAILRLFVPGFFPTWVSMVA